MIDLDLQPVANQSFSVTLDDSRYTIALREANGCMVVDLTRDDTVLLRGSRIVAGTPLIPYPYMQLGNFVLLTENDELPYYLFFGVSQSLVYVSADEIVALKGA